MSVTVLATVSFAWVCTAAADTHRPTAHPAKLPGTRQQSRNIWSFCIATWKLPIAVSPLREVLALPPRLPEVLVLQ